MLNFQPPAVTAHEITEVRRALERGIVNLNGPCPVVSPAERALWDKLRVAREAGSSGAEISAIKAEIRSLSASQTTQTMPTNPDRAPTKPGMDPTETRAKTLLEGANARAFRFSVVPEKPEPRFLINGVGISTPGNLTAIIAQAKAGKSSFLGSMIAAALCAGSDGKGCDTLGVTAAPPDGKILLHIDTEQSPYDADQLVRRALRRARANRPPAWLRSFALAGYGPSDLRSLLNLLLSQIGRESGIFAVLIDGAADLVADVNDAGEANGFVAEAHRLAITFDCPIIGVIHENPGSDHGKMRGHLGSQWERKAETNLRLRKQDEVVTVFSEKTRGAPILEKDGPRFTWSESEGMHVTAETKSSVREAERLSDLRDLAEEVFADGTLRYADACKKIESARRVGEKASEKWFTMMKKAGVVSKAELGFWRLTVA